MCEHSIFVYPVWIPKSNRSEADEKAIQKWDGMAPEKRAASKPIDFYPSAPADAEWGVCVLCGVGVA